MGGFAFNDLEIQFFCHACAAQLVNLAHAHMLGNIEDDPESRNITGQHKECLGIENVARKHGYSIAILSVHRGSTPPRIGGVNDVVMHETGAVHEFKSCSCFDESCRIGLGRWIAGAGCQEKERRTNTFAKVGQKVSKYLVDFRFTKVPDQSGNFGFGPVHQRLNRSIDGRKIHQFVSFDFYNTGSNTKIVTVQKAWEMIQGTKVRLR